MEATKNRRGAIEDRRREQVLYKPAKKEKHTKSFYRRNKIQIQVIAAVALATVVNYATVTHAIRRVHVDIDWNPDMPSPYWDLDD